MSVEPQQPPDEAAPECRSIADEIKDFHGTPAAAHELIRRLSNALADVTCHHCFKAVPVEIDL